MNRTEYRNSRQRDGDEVTYKMQAHIGILGTSRNGWTREVNIISWNGQDAGLDIRSWNQDHSKMSRGVNLNPSEAEALKDLLQDFEWESLQSLDWVQAQA